MGLQQWQCTYCGQRQGNATRPQPGICVKKGKTRDGKTKPHSWVKVK
jgi:hypothetical protein